MRQPETTELKSLALRVLRRDAMARQPETRHEKQCLMVVPSETPLSHAFSHDETRPCDCLTLAELPGLERRLRLAGWKVERVGSELRCWSGRKPAWRM